MVVPSVLWRCWLGGRKGIRPVKTEWWGAGVVICLDLDADLPMAQLLPLSLTVSCFSKIQIGFTFLVLAHAGGPGQRAVKRVCVCVRACVRVHVRVCGVCVSVYPYFNQVHAAWHWETVRNTVDWRRRSGVQKLQQGPKSLTDHTRKWHLHITPQLITTLTEETKSNTTTTAKHV